MAVTPACAGGNLFKQQRSQKDEKRSQISLIPRVTKHNLKVDIFLTKKNIFSLKVLVSLQEPDAI